MCIGENGLPASGWMDGRIGGGEGGMEWVQSSQCVCMCVCMCGTRPWLLAAVYAYVLLYLSLVRDESVSSCMYVGRARQAVMGWSDVPFVGS